MSEEIIDCGAAPVPLPSSLSHEQLRRWAKLIADGEDEFPGDLASPDRERLAARVRELLGERMLDLIARAIARDIVRRSRHRDKEVAP